MSGNPAQTFSLSEAAQGEGPGLVRLGELVREGLTLRAECWALMLEQHERLTQFIGAVQAPPPPAPAPAPALALALALALTLTERIA